MPSKSGSRLRNAENVSLDPLRKPIGPAVGGIERRYRRLFETAKDGIVILDADSGRILDANPRLLEMLGYTLDEAVGRTLWELGALSDIVSNRTAFRQLKRRGFLRQEDLVLETRHGGCRQVELVSNLYYEGEQQVIQCDLRDITERKSAESDAARARGELWTMVADLHLHEEELQRLIRLQTLLLACNTQDEAFQVISPALFELFEGVGGGLAIQRTHLPILETVATWGERSLIEPTFEPDKCWGMRRGQAHAVPDPRTGVACRHFTQPSTKNTLCVPLMVHGDALGVLSLVGALADGGPQRTGREALAVTAGEAIKLALSNLKQREALRDQANHDPLTGLYNRRYLEDSLARELYRARRAQTPLCLALLDLDHLKRYNDTFGHQAGDELLAEIGRVLRMQLRDSDIACRYGGDEFVLVLPDCSLADTEPRMKQIREELSRLGRSPSDSCTVSLGLAEAVQHDFDACELIRAADQALYAAKTGGRGQVGVRPARSPGRGRVSPHGQPRASPA